MVVTICLTCGDQGFPEALTFCFRCEDSAVHLYCLDDIPENFDEDITWVCEDCKLNTFQPSGSSISVCSNEVESNQSDPSPKNRNDSCDSVPVSPNEVHAHKLYLQNTNQINNFLPEDMHICQVSPSVSEFKHGENHDKHWELGKEKALVLYNGMDESVKALHVSLSDPGPLNIIYDENYCVNALPIIDPIWSGSFSISSEEPDDIDGLLAVAHLSNLACSKVCEVAKWLPNSVSLEFSHRCSVWPKSFEKLGPSSTSIALFFFPADKRHEIDFHDLIDCMIHKDLALKAILDGTELLVFPSTMLPKHYWRFQTKFYLWGVFRSKQQQREASYLTEEVTSGREKGITRSTCNGQNPVRPLSHSGNNYLSWIHDIERQLEVLNLEHTIKEGKEASLQDRAKAIIFLRRYLDERLKAEYLTIKDPLILWKNLNDRYNHQQKVILPKARHDWMHLCLHNFKTIGEYNSALFRLSSQLKLCGENITENDMITKTLSNFHSSNVLHQQFQDGRFRTYSDLISCIADKNNKLLPKNHQPQCDLVALPEVIAMSSNESGCCRVQGRERGKHRLSDGSKLTRTNLKKITMHHQEINGNYSSVGHKFSSRKLKKFKRHHKEQEINGDKLEKEKRSSDKYGQACFRCGRKGHLLRNCHTSRYLVDLYRASLREERE